MEMSIYDEFNDHQDFKERHSIESEDDLVCIKNLIPKAKPLMNKVQFISYQPKNYYPLPNAKLPDMLSQYQYHIDHNNMNLIDQSLFNHEKLKNDVAKVIKKKAQQPKIQNLQLVTLKQYYANKALIYQKYQANSNYFATYILNLAQLNPHHNKDSKNLIQSSYQVRKTTTPLLSQRFKTQRNTLSCRSSIEFNSNFQSGNLFKVYQREFNQYDLILQNDINTKGNNQWFFFSVRNVPKNATIKFNIVNLSKRFSLFEFGMKPSVFSMVKFQKRGVGWVRDGSKVHYKQSRDLRKQCSHQPYYCLSFEYKFVYEGDIVYFSYALPYTFQNFTNFITNKINDQIGTCKIKLKSLGHTLGGNEVNLFQISSPQLNPNKKSIWIIARQHSGETTSSFMLQGIIDYLLSNSESSQYLLANYVFKIVGMLNIDGVVHGNTRAQLIGCDSNRKWSDPHKIHHPIIFQLKKMIEKDNNEMILDLHSHSRKLGTFFYANHSPSMSKLIKVFPMLVCKNDERFDFKSNRFKGGSDLTARKVLFDILNIPFIYTVQSSFFGYQKEGDFKIIPYQPNDYREMGQNILKTFAQMTQQRERNTIKDERLLLCCQEQLQVEQNLWEKMNEADQIESVGSDEDPAQDQFNKKQLQLIIPKAPKKTTKNKKRRFSVKVQQTKFKKQVKNQQPQAKFKRMVPSESCYRKNFTGRCSLNLKCTDLKFPRKIWKQTKNAGVQADIPQKTILNRSTNINLPSQTQKGFQKKGLCIIGQKVQEELTLNGNCVGLQVQMAKIFLKNRNEVALSSQSLSKRNNKKSTRIGTIMLHNQNNFLNKGDILHSALRMFNKK